MHVDGYFIDPKNNDDLKSCDFKQLRKDKKKKQKLIDWEYQRNSVYYSFRKNTLTLTLFRWDWTKKLLENHFRF